MGRKAKTPADWSSNRYESCCRFSIAGFAPCLRRAGHSGWHHEANGYDFLPVEEPGDLLMTTPPVLDLHTLRKWTENYHAENHARREFAGCPLAPCWIVGTPAPIQVDQCCWPGCPLAQTSKADHCQGHFLMVEGYASLMEAHEAEGLPEPASPFLPVEMLD